MTRIFSVVTALVFGSAIVDSAYWKPTGAPTWWIQYAQVSSMSLAIPGVSIYNIDITDATAARMSTLHKNGKRVICYINAGAAETYRSDYSKFKAADLGNVYQGWPDERWVDIRSQNVRNIMFARIKSAANKTCDAIDPDNVNGYLKDNHSGFNFTATDQLNYNIWIASTAHALGMSVGLQLYTNIL